MRCEWQDQRGCDDPEARARDKWQRQVSGPLPPSSSWTFSQVPKAVNSQKWDRVSLIL